MAHVTVLSLGGSIIVPGAVDVSFISSFAALIRKYLAGSDDSRLIIVTGGGSTARIYQQAYRKIASEVSSYEQDLIGISATRLNAQLMRSVLLDLCPTDIVTDPTADFLFDGRVLIAAGWKPGFSTDKDAVVLAERFGAEQVVNLSNISKVYTADPKVDPAAEPVDHMGWKEFRAMVGDEWEPGKNVPFDPIAAKRASEIGLQVICAGGTDIENTMAILEGRPFIGTTIGPEWE